MKQAIFLLIFCAKLIAQDANDSMTSFLHPQDYSNLAAQERLIHQQKSVAPNQIKLQPVNRQRLSFNELFNQLEQNQHFFVMPNFPRYGFSVESGTEDRFSFELRMVTPDLGVSGDGSVEFSTVRSDTIKASGFYHDNSQTLDLMARYSNSVPAQEGIFAPQFKTDPQSQRAWQDFWMLRSISFVCIIESSVTLVAREEARLRVGLKQWLSASGSSSHSDFQKFEVKHATAQVSLPQTVDGQVVLSGQGILNICKRYAAHRQIRQRLSTSIKTQLLQYITNQNLANNCQRDSDCTKDLSAWGQQMLSWKGQTYQCLESQRVPGVKTCLKRAKEHGWCDAQGQGYPRCVSGLKCQVPKVSDQGVSCSYSTAMPMGMGLGGCPAAINPHVGVCVSR